MGFEQRQLSMDSSHVLVHVRAVLGAVIAVYASETSLVEIAVGAKMAHHAVPREETVGASRTVEPGTFFRLLLTCKHVYNING